MYLLLPMPCLFCCLCLSIPCILHACLFIMSAFCCILLPLLCVSFTMPAFCHLPARLYHAALLAHALRAVHLPSSYPVLPNTFTLPLLPTLLPFLPVFFLRTSSPALPTLHCVLPACYFCIPPPFFLLHYTGRCSLLCCWDAGWAGFIVYLPLSCLLPPCTLPIPSSYILPSYLPTVRHWDLWMVGETGLRGTFRMG